MVDGLDMHFKSILAHISRDKERDMRQGSQLRGLINSSDIGNERRGIQKCQNMMRKRWTSSILGNKICKPYAFLLLFVCFGAGD